MKSAGVRKCFFNLSTKEWGGLRIEKEGEDIKHKTKVCAKAKMLKYHRFWRRQCMIVIEGNVSWLVENTVGKIRWHHFSRLFLDPDQDV